MQRMQPEAGSPGAKSTSGAFVASLIDSSRRAWANNCAWRMGHTHPEMAGAPTTATSGGWHSYFDSLLQHVSAALEYDAPELLTAQAQWLRISFDSHGLEPTLATRSLVSLREELAERLPTPAAPAALALIDRALEQAALPIPAPTNGLSGQDATASLAREYLLAALEGRREDAVALALNALERGLSVEQLSREVLGRVQNELGAMWHRSQMSIVEEHLVSRTTEEVLTRLRSRVSQTPRNGMKVLVTSVDGDLHDIGLRVVADQFEMAGWQAVYLGASTPPADAALAAAEFEVHVVAAGAKLVSQLKAAARLVELLRADPRTRALPVIFGGRPFELAPNLWRALGADGMASNASGAVELATRLVRRGA